MSCIYIIDQGFLKDTRIPWILNLEHSMEISIKSPLSKNHDRKKRLSEASLFPKFPFHFPSTLWGSSASWVSTQCQGILIGPFHPKWFLDFLSTSAHSYKVIQKLNVYPVVSWECIIGGNLPSHGCWIGSQAVHKHPYREKSFVWASCAMQLDSKTSVVPCDKQHVYCDCVNWS